MEQLWTEKQVSEYLKIAANTLAGWRSAAKGPRWIQLPTGSIRYQPEEVRQWAHSRKDAK